MPVHNATVTAKPTEIGGARCVHVTMQDVTELRRVEAALAQIRPGVAELRPGQRFEGRFACLSKERQTARNGSTYLSLRLRDRAASEPPSPTMLSMRRISSGRWPAGSVLRRADRQVRRGQLVVPRSGWLMPTSPRVEA